MAIVAPELKPVVELIERQRDEGLHAGAQLYVSLHGQVLCDTAVGEAAPGVPLTPEHLMLLYSAGKPFTTVAVLQLVERGVVGLDDPVARFVPAWGAGKEACTVRHVLTHMGGFATCELFDEDISYDEAVTRIAAHPAEYPPGTRAGYHPSSGWKVLGEIIRVADGRDVSAYLRDEVFAAAGLPTTRLGVPLAEQATLGPLLSPVHWRGHMLPARDADGSVRMAAYRADEVHNQPWWTAKVEPGGGARAPARELGRFYEVLAAGGHGLFHRPFMVDLMTATHRAGVRDRTFLRPVPWGLGVVVAGGISGTSVGHRVFGHGGMASSRAFCDPVEGLVVAFVSNGLAGLLDNERRLLEVTDAVYAAAAPVPSGARTTVEGRAGGFST